MFINFTYEPHKKTVKQDDLSKHAFEVIQSNIPAEFTLAFDKAPTEKNKNRTVLEKHLNDFISRNSFDYFIHKDLGGFLSRELDFYIKNEVLFIDDINTENPVYFTAQLSKIKALKLVASKIINFLAQIENFQKKLWLKKKFVISTNYCITLDRIPEKYYPEIASNEAQLNEWKELFNVVIPNGSKESLRNEPFLVLDTKFFSEEFKDKLLSEFDNLDEETNGLLINSENFQALNIMQEKYEDAIKTIYIDPPYNTDSSEIAYKNTFKHSTWMSLMHNRIALSRSLQQENGFIYLAIDDLELFKLNELTELLYSRENFIANVSVVHKPEGRNQEKFFGTSNEYMLVYSKNKSIADFYTVILDDSIKDKFDLFDNSGSYKRKDFGVINVGDEKKLHDLAIANNVYGTERDFSDSLFKKINEESSTINLLIGSKKFTEGWSSWRVSSMGLMNVGKSEGSQIIQLFGRGVRLKGYNFSLKRSSGLDDYQKPTNLRNLKKYLRPLETLQIFGVKADYMEKFKEFLEEEGLPTNDSAWITIKVPTIQKEIVNQNKLKLIAVKDSENFKQKVIVPLIYNTSIFHGKLVELDWYPKIDVLDNNNSRVAINKNEAFLNDSHLSMINWNAVYLELQNFKADKGYHNLKIELEELQDIMQHVSWYKLLIPEHKVNFSQFSNTFIWQELVVTLLKKYIEQYYLFYKNEFSSDHVEAIQLQGSDDNFVLEYDFRLNTEEEIEDYQNKIEQLKLDVVDPAFTNVQIGTEVDAFDNLLHLYKPLVYVGKGYKEKLQVSPIPLDASEKQFLDDLITYVGSKPTSLEGKEVHVLRNQSKKGLGFFTDGNNFYPDFIVWIVEENKQRIIFVDPKGIRNSKGINDPKIQFYKVLKEKIKPQVEKAGIELDSFVISNTSYLEVNWKDNLSIEEFNKNNVYFQKENASTYIESILT